MLRRVASNSVLTMLGFVWRMAVSVILTPFLIRSLGAALYGVWVLVLSFSVAGYLSLFSLGIQGALVKQIAEHHARGETDRVNVLFSAALAAFAAIAVVAALLVLVFAYAFLTRTFNIPPELVRTAEVLLTIMALQSLIEFPAMAVLGVIEGLQRYDLLAAFDAARSTIFAVAAVVALRNGAGAVMLGVVVLVLSGANLLAASVAAQRLLPSLRLSRQVSGPAVMRMARVSGQMLLLRINGLVYNQMDKAILGVMMTTTALTHYDVVARFHALALIATGFISSVVMPGASALYAVGDRPQLRKLFMTATKYSVAISVPISLVIMVLARPLLRLWLGPAFTVDAGLVRLMLVYTLYFGLVQVGWNLMVGMDRIAAIVRIAVWTTGLNLLISIVATPWLGIAGVLWGTLVGNSVSSVLYLRLCLRTLDIGVKELAQQVLVRAYPPALIGAAVVGGLSIVRPADTLVLAAAYGGGALVLAAALFVTIGTDAPERALLRSLVGLRVAPARS